jgi:hypothetical protein
MNIRMRVGACVAASAAGLLTLSGIARAGEKPDDNGFLKPRAEIVASVKTIGVMPLEIDKAVPDAAGVREHYESEVVARLERAGFSVVKPSVMRAIHDRLGQALGGVYDPTTGKPDAGKFKALRDFELNEYLATQKVDAVLRIGVVERLVDASGASAAWDGVKDSYTGRGSLTDLFGGDAYIGRLSALSFHVALDDSYGTQLYRRYGGLQLLEYVPLPADRGLIKRARLMAGVPSSIMADPARDERALALALDPLTLGQPPAAGEKIPPGPAARLPDRFPLRVRLRDFNKRYHRFALAPLELPEPAAHADAQREYHDLLAQRLHQLGYTVVGEDTYAQLWAAELASSGGFYNRYTGALERERLAAARARIFAALRDKFGIDAVVQPSVVARMAQFQYLQAGWDGAEEWLARKGSLGGMMDPSSNYIGTIPALSLIVRITNAANEIVYEEYGGIQVMDQLDNGHEEALPESQLLTNKKQNATAVYLALESLIPPPPDN